MMVWRRWIFPILLVLVFGAIAAALLRMAFFADAGKAAEQPGAEMTSPLVEVQTGSVANELSLQGSVAQDEDRSVRATANGAVTAVHAKVGDRVAAGDPLFTIKQDEPVKFVDVTAETAGTLTEFSPLLGQMVGVGEESAKISPASFHILATVEPVQLYRLVGAPGEGTVTITGGPAPFTCTRLSTQVAEDGTTSVRCRVPAKQTVFPGLPVQLTISIGSADDVLVVPTTAVKGGAGSGIVWVDAGDGTAPGERKVKLGLNDGENVEVRKGLKPGEQVLQFVPGTEAPAPEENCWEIAPGQMECESGARW